MRTSITIAVPGLTPRISALSEFPLASVPDVDELARLDVHDRELDEIQVRLNEPSCFYRLRISVLSKRESHSAFSVTGVIRFFTGSAHERHPIARMIARGANLVTVRVDKEQAQAWLTPGF